MNNSRVGKVLYFSLILTFFLCSHLKFGLTEANTRKIVSFELEHKIKAHHVKKEQYGIKKSILSTEFLNNSVVLTGGAQGRLKKWNISELKSGPKRVSDYQGDRIRDLKVKKSDQLIAGLVETQDGTKERVILWEAESLREKQVFSEDVLGRIVGFSPSKKQIAVPFRRDKTLIDLPWSLLQVFHQSFAPLRYGVRLYNYETGDLDRQVLTLGTRLQAFDFSPSGRRIANGGITDRGTLWSLEDTPEFLGSFYHSGADRNPQIHDVEFSSRGEYLLSSGPYQVNLWDSKSAEWEWTLNPHVESGKVSQPRSIFNVEFVPQENIFVGSTNGGELQVYQLHKDKPLKTVEITSLTEEDHHLNDSIWALDVSPNGTKIAVGTQKGFLYIFNLNLR